LHRLLERGIFLRGLARYVERGNGFTPITTITTYLYTSLGCVLSTTGGGTSNEEANTAGTVAADRIHL
jgi:hypothetical protein